MAQSLEDIQQAAIAQVKGQVSARDLFALELKSSLESYSRAMFKAQYGSSLIVADLHKKLFAALQSVVDGDVKHLIINMPPRYGKTLIAIKMFVSWCFALNPKCQFMHLSYSDLLVNDNSSTIREIMTLPLYKELFPQSALLNENKGSTRSWETKAKGSFYAVSTQGQVTGFGAGAMQEMSAAADAAMAERISQAFSFDEATQTKLALIGAASNVFPGAIVIDDPLKPEDAASDIVRERINSRFENTIRSRANSRETPIIIIMQRLHEHDLCGYLLDTEPDNWTVLSLPALRTETTVKHVQDESGEDVVVEETEEVALWPVKHTVEELRHLQEVDPLTYDTQYQQDPTPKEGLMYEGFKTYNPADPPQAFLTSSQRWNYTDTADTGADFLASGSFVNTPMGAYITDILYSDEPMEVTEPKLARMLTTNKTKRAKIEGNNGGRQFARSVKRILREELHNMSTVIETFTQTKNKQVRIFSNSALVCSDIYFPEGWEKKWPKFAAAIKTYRKKNNKSTKHDDAPDMLTGIIEMRTGNSLRRGIKRGN